jgi:hypothetical protein
MNLYWSALTWIIPAFLLLFGAGETYAIATKRATYTEWIRMKLGLFPLEPRRRWMAPLFGFLLGGFTAWFLPHIELGIWPS